MRYPRRTAYRTQNAREWSGYQSYHERKERPAKTRIIKGKRVSHIGAHANDQGLFRQLKPREVGFGRKGLPGVPQGNLKGRANLVGPILKNIPALSTIGTITAGLDWAIDSVVSANYPFPVVLPPDGGGWYQTAGTWNNYGPSYQTAPSRQSALTWHERIAGQSVGGLPLGSPVADFRTTMGFWIKTGDQISVTRWAHHRSFKRDAPGPSGEFKLGELTTSISLTPAVWPFNPYLSPLIPPGLLVMPSQPVYTYGTTDRGLPEHAEMSSSGPQPKVRTHKHVRTNPPKGTKEKKFIASIVRGSPIDIAISAATEAHELAGIMFDSLPDHVKWQAKLAHWDKQRAAGEKLTKLGYLEMSQAIYDNFDKINWQKAGEGIRNNFLEDFLFGLVGKVNAKASRRAGRPVGFQFGPAL